MGFRGDYVVTRRAVVDVAAALDLTVLDAIDQVPHEAAWIGTLKSGWTILWPALEGYALDLKDALRGLSEDGEVLSCSVNETVMSASAISYAQGLKSWQVSWTSDVADGEDSLSQSGVLPDIADDILIKLKASMSHNDDAEPIFEYPIRLVEHQTGFTYDGLYTVDDFASLSRVRLPYHPHMSSGVWGWLSRCFENRPLVTLIFSVAFTAISIGLASVWHYPVLETLISALLGDWADYCLSNCHNEVE